MTLRSGTRLGPYEIVAAAGGGGMGEVYRARDTRLDRTVAIKVLPSEFSENVQLRMRLEREARAVAALSHPHICTLHDVGRENGLDYLVMEFIEGETLSQKIARGPLPLEQVLRYGMQIADALRKAHKSGLIHRDLKPGNIMVTSKAGVKLLDFGLAKQIPIGDGSISRSETANLEEPLTNKGTIVGTVQYMSPEQLEGKAVDARTDIFALGCILYQMATGTHPFKADSQAGVIAAILNQEPPSISKRQPIAPKSFDRLVRTCLAKDPDDRIQAAHDVWLQLQSISDDLAPAPPGLDRGRARRRNWAAAILAASLLGVLGLTLLSRPQRSVTSVRTSSIVLPNRILEVGSGRLAFSPDGSKLALSLRGENGSHRLYVRSMEDGTFVALAGTDEAQSPFFSPDGQWLAFGASGKMKRLPVAGGPVHELTDASYLNGADWSDDGRIVFAPSYDGGLSLLSAEEGRVRPLTAPDAANMEFAHRWPTFLPGDESILFTVYDLSHDLARAKAVVLSLADGKRTDVLDNAVDARYLPTGHLVFFRDDVLYAAPFDLHSLRLTQPPTRLSQQVANSWFGGRAAFDVSRDGSLVYLAADRRALERELVWVSRSGEVEPLSKLRRPFNEPRLSPDGRNLVVAVGDGRADLWVNELSRDAWTRLTHEGATNTTPLWSPDGREVFFSSNRLGRYHVFAMPFDGTGPARKLSDRPDWPWPVSITPDGKTLALMHIDEKTGSDIWLVPTDGSGSAEAFLASAFSEYYFAFSPDGKWIAHTSNESGRVEVYLQPYPLTGRPRRVSEDGGTMPKWSRDGREIFYRHDRKVMAVPVKTEPDVVIGKPVMLFEGDYHSVWDAWDVAPDGKRFVMIRKGETDPVSQLTLVHAWSDWVRRTVTPSR